MWDERGCLEPFPKNPGTYPQKTTMPNNDINTVILYAFLDIAHVLYALEIDNDPGSINRKALKDTLDALQEAHPKTLRHPYTKHNSEKTDD